MSRPHDIPESVWEWADIFCDEHRAIEDDREMVARAYMMASQRGPSAGLTQSQARVLDFASAFIAEHGYSPKYTEIAKGAGFVTKSRVCTIVGQLEERGFVKRLPHRARSLTIVQNNNVSTAHKISGEA